MNGPDGSGIYDSAIQDIQSATSLGDLNKIADRYSAAATGDNGALYSGSIGQYGSPTAVTSDNFIAQIESHTDTPLINRTERGQFLGNRDVSAAMESKAQDIFINEYHASPADAGKMASSYLYGSTTPGQTSLADSQWGRASAAYAQSLHGDVPVFATNANPDRIFGQVEFKTALNNPNVTSIGGVTVGELRDQVARDGGNVSGALQTAQQSFRNDVANGLFVGPNNQPVMSQEFADKYKVSGTYEPASQLRSSGLSSPDLNAAIVPYSPGLAAPDAPPMDPVARGSADAPSFTMRPSGGAGLTPEGAGLAADAGGISLGSVARGAGVVGTVALGTYDAVQTAHQYSALEANGNSFAANQYLRTQAIVTASSVGGAIVGSAAAGAAYGAAGGAETGPGAIITGLAGGVIGGTAAAIGGEKYAEHLTRESVDHDTGTDGKTYQFKDGSWETTHPFYEPWKSDSAAPADQVPKLNMERTEKLTDLAMEHPTTIDPNKIEAKDPRTGETHTWQRAGAQEWSTSGNATGTQASPELAAQLNQQSAMRTAMGTNSADVAAKGYVTDYYGKGWDKLGPIPQSVATQLHLPSETQVKDPATGVTWNVNGNNVSRMSTPGSPGDNGPAPAGPANAPTAPTVQPTPGPPQASLAPTPGPPQPGAPASPAPAQGVNSPRFNPTPNPQPESAPPQLVTATPAEQARVLAARDQAVASNHLYGQNLIQQQFDTMRATSPALGANGQAPPNANVGQPPPTPTSTPTPAPTPGSTTSVPAVAPATPAAFQMGSGPDGQAVFRDAVQSRLDTLRANGVALPDVTSVQPYSPHTQTGSFVQVSDDLVAQHMGRGAYQVASVSRDLNGVTPPEGQTVTIDRQGQVADREQSHGLQRMM